MFSGIGRLRVTDSGSIRLNKIPAFCPCSRRTPAPRLRSGGKYTHAVHGSISRKLSQRAALYRSQTEKGKHRTRLNAYRHGLTGQVCLLTADEHEAFDQHCTGILTPALPSLEAGRIEQAHMAKRQSKSLLKWTDVKAKLATFDRNQLLSLVQDLYAAHKDNQTFLHNRFGLVEDVLGNYKETIDR